MPPIFKAIIGIPVEPIKMLARLEPSTTESSLVPGFAARIADPAWLLARQWQFGELRGEDAATPVRVALELELVPIDGLAPHGEADTPLEPTVEAQDAAAETAPGRVRLAAELGLGARRVLLAAGADAVWAALKAQLPLASASADADAGLRLLARRSLDGLALAHLLDESSLDASRLATLTGLPASGLQPAVVALLAWRSLVAAWVVRPPTPDPWDAARFEHRFTLRSTDRTIDLPAAEYPGGRLDWYSVDIHAPAPKDPRPPEPVRHAIPLPIQFPGMPVSRWWDLEDEAVNLNDLEAGPEDMIRMLAVELMTSFADDWYLVPVRLPLGRLVRIRSLQVEDTFSYKKQPVPLASFAQQDGPRRTWRMFELSGHAPLAAPNAAPGPGPWIFLAPTVADALESEPIEEVRFLRDEASNLGWAVERTLEGADGRPRRHAEPRAEPVAPRGDAGWAWQLVSAVPRGWIPLAPVPTGVDAAGIALRRARLPNWTDTDGARATLLSPGEPLIIPEEELPAGGIVVVRTWQRTRGAAGEVLLWQGRQKRPGTGEPAAELLFDRLLR